MAQKSPRFVRGYPLKAKTGIRRRGRGAVKWPLIRQPRPVRHRRSWMYRTRTDAQAALEARAEPGVRGSLEERIVHKALTDRGFIPGIDFDFQSSMSGGRQELGGLVADFVFPLPRAILQIQSVWHTMTLELERRDEDQAAMLQAQGFMVFELWPPIIHDAQALDEWITRYIMGLWGTSTGGGHGVGAFDTPFLSVLEYDLWVRIEHNLDAALERLK